MATKINTMAKKLVKLYKEQIPDSDYVVIEHDSEVSWSAFDHLKKHGKRYKIKSFCVSDVVPISDSEHPGIVWGVQPVKYKKETLSYGGRQGTFRIEFNDNSIIMATWFIQGFGRNTSVECLMASEVSTIYKLKKLFNKQRKYSMKPNTGFYKVFSTQMGLSYSKVEHPSLIETIHPTIDKLEEDIQFFYNNVDIFTRYGMPGVRKAMLIGPPGTGKTSMCIKFARAYSKTHNVSVCTDIQSAAGHLVKCAKYSVPTLLILEDAEATLSGKYGEGTDSSILNFLDGVDQPTNKAGSYVIMTTNHPDKIENRVLKRPGRIDRIYKVGPLHDSYALDCAKIYFGSDIKYTKNNKEGLISIVSGMTGAQIRELSNSVRAYCASNQLEINVNSIKEVSKKLTEDLSDASKFAEDNSLMLEQKAKPFGFASNPNQQIDF